MLLIAKLSNRLRDQTERERERERERMEISSFP